MWAGRDRPARKARSVPVAPWALGFPQKNEDVDAYVTRSLLERGLPSDLADEERAKVLQM